jgi:hypothetical protein
LRKFVKRFAADRVEAMALIELGLLLDDFHVGALLKLLWMFAEEGFLAGTLRVGVKHSGFFEHLRALQLEALIVVVVLAIV